MHLTMITISGKSLHPIVGIPEKRKEVETGSKAITMGFGSL